eukprot:123749-Amphidinium_carterae.1
MAVATKGQNTQTRANKNKNTHCLVGKGIMLLGDKKSHYVRLTSGKRVEVKHALSSNKLENRLVLQLYAPSKKHQIGKVCCVLTESPPPPPHCMRVVLWSRHARETYNSFK